ncbi:TetR family transcriptional regulator [Staphylococcus condimenti]|uniref:TetR family transcriptional regulator n=2 Tax=Staphylococcus condimenti TaxID=70255 RepID=A0A4Q7CSN3_9STAP|nr:TetR family transcriptional regulator [Staphylococcus condimenti]RZI01519.1 TetR family transcriptional regulator [Staphylococcus condimenti]
MNKLDLRVVRTRKLLLGGLYELLEEKEFSKLTIDQICDRSMVHRTTFYKHFHDKYELLEVLLNNLSEEFFSYDFKERINHPFRVKENAFEGSKDFHRILIKQKEDKEFNDLIFSHFIKLIQQDVKDNINLIEKDPSVPDDLVFYLYGGAIKGFSKWIENSNAKITAEEADNVFHKMVNIKVKE